MPSFKLTLAYDGTGFVGWQRQAAGTSIQGLLEAALSDLDQRQVAVAGAGRTDAGVHALGQVASFPLQRPIDERTLVRALNARLPPAVRALDAEAVGPAFHARFAARAKTYRYRLWNGDVLSPFERAYVWHLPGPPLDVDAMAAAARLIEGCHDFASFQSIGTEVRSTERTVFSARISVAPAPDQPDPAGAVGAAVMVDRPALITLEVKGDGFLRHMVRTLVGTLVAVGRGRHDATWITAVLAAQDRHHAGPTAPAEGLFLVGVEYDRQL
jgi:tRNA pseudouridine38-40 synthase